MPEPLDYGEFGRRFVPTIVTPERVRQTVASAAAGDMTTSVRLAGGIVTAEGGGQATGVEVELLSDEPLAYRAMILAELMLNVRIARVPHRYRGRIRIPLVLTAHTYDDMTIAIDIADVAERDMELELRSLGTAAAIIERIGEVSEQVKREIAQLVNSRKDDPKLEPLRRLEMLTTIEEEWQRRTQDGA
ncbi:MAG: hypothetical protein WD646_05025 [Actinomycetota bacterium]